MVATDGALRSIPWSALPLRGEPLILNHDITFLPGLLGQPLQLCANPRGSIDAGSSRLSAAGIATDQRATHGADVIQDSWASLIIADPNRDLPDAGHEGRRLATLLPSPLLLAGDSATAKAVLARLPRATLIHFAGHAMVDEDHPYLSYLQLARGTRVNLMDLYDVRLRATSVFLNACSAGQVVAEGGGALGIANEFMASGARAVVATLWDVPDHEAEELSYRFYTYMLEQEMASFRALSRVQRELAQGKFSKSGQKVSVWASYFALGDGNI